MTMWWPSANDKSLGTYEGYNVFLTPDGKFYSVEVGTCDTLAECHEDIDAFLERKQNDFLYEDRAEPDLHPWE
jgi:hypothetical protein